MEVKVTIRLVTIKDDKTGQQFTVKTIRTAEEIAEYVVEDEKEHIVSKLEEAVSEALVDDKPVF